RPLAGALLERTDRSDPPGADHRPAAAERTADRPDRAGADRWTRRAVGSEALDRSSAGLHDPPSPVVRYEEPPHRDRRARPLSTHGRALVSGPAGHHLLPVQCSG